MSTDAILAGKATKSYNELTKATIATAQPKAAEDLIVKNQVQQFGNDDKLQKLKTNLAQYNKQLAVAQKELDAYHSHPVINGSTFGTGDTEDSSLFDKLVGIRDKANAAQQAIDHLNTDSTLLNRQNETFSKAVIGGVEKDGGKSIKSCTNHK